MPNTTAAIVVSRRCFITRPKLSFFDYFCKGFIKHQRSQSELSPLIQCSAVVMLLFRAFICFAGLFTVLAAVFAEEVGDFFFGNFGFG